MRKWIFIIGSVIAGVAAFMLLSGSDDSELGGGFGIPLVRAAVSANFLEEEAGISAYFKAPSTVSLALARDAYVVIERDEPDYLLGWVAPQDDGTGEFNVRVYTASNGWVVAYYLRGEATSKIVDLSAFSGGAFDTRLEQALQRVASATGASMGRVGYYHFGYPVADALMVIVGERAGAEKTFDFTIPSDLAVSEISWWLEGSPGKTEMSIRETTVAVGAGGTAYGVNTTSLPRNVPTEVKVFSVFDRDGRGAIVIVYGQ